MKRIALVILLLLTTPALAQPPPDRFVWRPIALGTIFVLWRGDQRTGWTMVEDQDAGLWRLNHDGVRADSDANRAALAARGITEAGGP